MSAFETLKMERLINRLREHFVDGTGHLDNAVMNRFNEISKNLSQNGYKIQFDEYNNVLRVVNFA